jgi:hypothetical protein
MRLFAHSVVFLLMLSCISCQKEFLTDPPPDYTIEVGAFPKLINIESGEFDLSDLVNSEYIHSVDFIDGNGGLNVHEYLIYISTEQPGQQETVWELFRTVESREFMQGVESNQVGHNLVIPFSEVAAFLEVEDLSVFSSGDSFSFRTELTKQAGRVFSSSNSTPSINNNVGAIWDFQVEIN